MIIGVRQGKWTQEGQGRLRSDTIESALDY